MQIPLQLEGDQAEALRTLAEQMGKSCTEILHEAVVAYLAAQPKQAEAGAPKSLSEFHGLWKDNPETQDIEAYRRRLWCGDEE